MKLRIGIITFHSAWNYGAVLQCVALSQKLQSMGHSVCVIDYRPKHKQERVVRNPLTESMDIYRSLEGKPFLFRGFRFLRRGIRCILDWRKIPEYKKKQRAFEDFLMSKVCLTQRYTNLEQLRDNPPELDVYICGSDQLWNPSLTHGGWDSAYFLDFGSKNVKRLSYAVSACNIKGNNTEKLSQLLKNLDVISLREKKYQKLIGSLAEKEVTIMPDPTQLLTAQEYEVMEESYHTGGAYAFVYMLSKDEAISQCNALVQRLSKEKNLIFVDGSPNKFCKTPKLKGVNSLSPGEWLYLIHHAEHIITNSFHCLSFAAIYRKDCFILPCHESRMERLEEFAERIGISARILYSVDDIEKAIQTDIDFCALDMAQRNVQRSADNFFAQVLSDNPDGKGQEQ